MLPVGTMSSFSFLISVCLAKLTKATFDCFASHSCIDGITAFSNCSSNCDIFAYGYKSASDPTISFNNSNGSLDCHGSFSCYHINYANVHDSNFYGDHAISNAVLGIRATGKIHCYGANSCSNNKRFVMRDALLLGYCFGTHSCSNSHITLTTSSIFGIGPYSLLNSLIEPTVSGTGIYLAGYYTGYNATLKVSNSSFKTYIYCWGGNGCKNFNVDCGLFTSEECPVFVTIAANGSDTPVFLYSNSNISSANISNINEIDDLYIDINKLSIYYDDECTNDNNSITFDNYNDFNNGNNNNNTENNVNNSQSNICCRSYLSCNQFSVNSIETFCNESNIICSGGISCCNITSIIAWNGDIICTGAASCTNINLVGMMSARAGGSIRSIENDDDDDSHGMIYCAGYGSCSNSIIYNTCNVYCAQSCIGSKIISSKNIYLLGDSFSDFFNSSVIISNNNQ